MLRANLNRPQWPFILVFILPVITALAGFAVVTKLPDCGLDEPSWEAGHLRLAFLLGLLNLLPSAWILSRNSRVRKAAGISGVMGAAQLALPQAAIAAYAAGPGAVGQAGVLSCSISSFLLPWLALGMFILWLACVIISASILYGMARRQG